MTQDHPGKGPTRRGGQRPELNGQRDGTDHAAAPGERPGHERPDPRGQRPDPQQRRTRAPEQRDGVRQGPDREQRQQRTARDVPARIHDDRGAGAGERRERAVGDPRQGTERRGAQGREAEVALGRIGPQAQQDDRPQRPDREARERGPVDEGEVPGDLLGRHREECSRTATGVERGGQWHTAAAARAGDP